MAPEITLISQLSVMQIFEVTSNSESDLKAWIANGQYLLDKPLSLNGNNRSVDFSLAIKQKTPLFTSLANDCNRFAQAAIESMWSINTINNLPKSSGWAAVQMYYSAFFAIHAILRLFGRSCTQLEDVHVKKVHDIAVATRMDSGSARIENGFYASVLNNDIIEYRKLKDSHADTWFSFLELLTWIIDNISNTTGLGKHKSDAVDFISSLKLAISQSPASKGNWPSQIRNKVNYQHSHGVWFPYKEAVHDCSIILKNDVWIKDPKTFNLTKNSNGEIQLLFNVCNAILSFMYQMIKYGYERAGCKTAPLNNGVFKLTNLLKI